MSNTTLAGGVLGTVVTIAPRDTQTNPRVGVDSARALVDVENVAAIVGALSNGVTIAAVKSVTVPNGVLHISAASTSPAITVLSDNDFLFRAAASNAAQGSESNAGFSLLLALCTHRHVISPGANR